MIDYATLDSMREMAKDDTWHGATYETIIRLCDEVERLKEELSLYKDRIMTTSHGPREINNNSGFLEIHEKEIHDPSRKPQRMHCYNVNFVYGSSNPRLCKIETVGVCTTDSIQAWKSAKKSLLEGKHIDAEPTSIQKVERI